MSKTIRKPAGWCQRTLDDLMSCEAGQAYVVNQLGFELPPDEKFRSTRSSECAYEYFDDGSLWLISGSEDEVAVDAGDWIQDNLRFDGVRWDDDVDVDLPEMDQMDRGLLVYVYGDEEARAVFSDLGGSV